MLVFPIFEKKWVVFSIVAAVVLPVVDNSKKREGLVNELTIIPGLSTNST